MAGGQVVEEPLGTCSTEELIQGGRYTLLAALTHWSDPSDPCAASRRVVEVIRAHQVLPMWLPEAGDLLVQQVEQAVASKSPGILSHVELLKEYAKSRQLEDEKEEDDYFSASPIVKGYALLCGFPTEGVVSGECGFNCADFVRGLTYLFNLLLEHSRKAVVCLSCLVGESQLRAVVDTGQSMFLRCTILKDLNELLINLNSAAREKFRRICHGMFITLPGLLCEVGNYDTQASIVELMYRMTTSAERSCYVNHWFPSLDCTIQCLFLTISEFDPHCRRFLNAYNASLGESRKVHTIPCHAAHIGKLKLCKPKSTSYPRFWIDFNLGSSSILILCQVEGKSQANDPWECLFIESEDVQSVTLTCRVHSYTLEMEYSNIEAVEDLFSTPLSMESRSLLSCVVFFEFSPHALLEKLCTLLYGSKLTVIKLEPKGWRRKADRDPSGGTQMGTSSSSSCTWGRKYSGAVTDVDVNPNIPSAPEEAVTQNGILAHLTSTQSTTASSRKHYTKSSAVSLICDVDKAEENVQAGASSRSQKPPSTKRLKASAVFLNLGPKELAESSEKEADGAVTTEREERPTGNKTRKGREKTKRSRGLKKRVKASHVKCIVNTALNSSEVSPRCYIPLSFTSPVPGAAIKKGRVTREAKVTATSTKEATQEKDENQSSPRVEEEKRQPPHASSKQSEMQEVTNEVCVILPSSEESPILGQDTSKATNVTHDVQSMALNTEESPDSDVENIKTTAHDIRHKTHSSDVATGVGSSPGGDSKLSDTQTNPAVRKESKCTKMNTGPSTDFKSDTTKPVKADVMQKRGETSPTHHRTHDSSPDDVDPTQRKPESDKPHEADLACNSKPNTPRQVERDTVQINLDSAKPIETESPQVKPHSTKPVITSHTQKKPDSASPVDTSPIPASDEGTLIETHPTHDKPDSPKPLEIDPALSSTASSVKESPIPAGQIHDEELFDSDSSLHQREVFTQPFEEAATTAKTASPTPPQSRQPEPTASPVSKDVNDKHTPPETVRETPHIRSIDYEPLPKMIQLLLPRKESTKVAANDSANRSTFIENWKKIKMSPFLKIMQMNINTSFQYEGSPHTARSDPVEALRPQEEASLIEKDSQIKGSAGKSKESSVTNSPRENTNNMSRKDDAEVIVMQEVVALGTVIQEENTNRSKDKSATRQSKQPCQDQHQHSPKKGVLHQNSRSRRNTPQGCRPKKTGTKKEQQASYPVLHKLGGVSPARRSSTGKIRNKRKLFDPTAQSSVEVNLLQMPQVKEANPQTFEDNQDMISHVDSKTSIKSHPPDHKGETTDKIKPQSTKKRRRVSEGEGYHNTSRYNQGKRSAKKKAPPRRASGFLDDSGLEEEPHSIYSDIESSPVGEVDSWYLQRIEKIKHNVVTYHNTSSRKSSQRQERDQKVKKRKYSIKDNKSNSTIYTSTSSDIERHSDGETLQNSLKKTLSSSSTSRDATEQIYNYTSPTDRPKKAAIHSKMSYPVLPAKSTSTSEVSQASSHDEWEPPSSKKKKSLPKKENPKLFVTRSTERRARRQQRCSKDGSSLNESQQQVGSTFDDSAILADTSEFLGSSVEALRHTSRSSVDSSTSNFMNFKLAASKGKITDNAKMDGGGDIKCSSVAPQTPSPEPQESVEPQISSPMHQSPVTTPQISSPVLHVPSPALEVLSPLSQIDSPDQKLNIHPATEDLQGDSDTNQPLEQSNETPGTQHHPSSSASMPKVLQAAVASTQPFNVRNTPDSPKPLHPSQTLSAMDISAILKPGPGTQAPFSGPFQSTMLDSLLDKSKSPAPRFSYVSEAEMSYVNNEELTVVRDENSATHKSPSSNDPIKAELRYDRDQTPSLTTFTTTADVHQSVHCIDNKPLDQSSLMTSEQADSPHKSLQTEPPPHPSHKASRNELKGQERLQTITPQVQPSHVHSVTPTAKVPPQSAGTPIYGSRFSSRMYKQLIQDLQQTPLSSRHEGSPVHAQSKNLFGAVKRDAARDERVRSSALNVDMLAALMAVKADVERVSNSMYRLSHSLGAMLTHYMEQLNDDSTT